ncbi:HPr(Ser) kinase/phosphatase [Anaerocolumna aminovalerica]|jgi:HPr kinase/phosphorylase|uniref:HPr kinase/phosphorylase n=1 Tax=Anaerocolumna aminovalerica TaxID=1527 RepID=A0A1I5DLH2_9FIRM|nr:HPr(Ser) kinase/phosphatase [Anaerocolumna aminovalerica]MBU5332221.1 HPr(Ser) kinase/phosphatase [Anaerocolumna aminovalerica]MDU6263925.1 HPr(Ser) kinase/phosphatase [Anaerocolumna aminovalerica]SFN99987.1 Hpr(Ser) kinase/phosphatase [Anaerocolumna aminovalerica]
MYTVELATLIGKMNLEVLTPDIDYKHIKICQPDVNRPALQLAGFFDHFDSDRVQIIGRVEEAYMRKMEKDHGIGILSRLMDYKVPCIVFCRGIDVEPELIQLATQKCVPILKTNKTTSSFMAEVIRWLNVELAPRMSIHGVLVDVYGEGILITGESGIGKSEAALELIKRGHRLVTDDVVEIKKVSDETLIGMAPDITRHFIELRGIGIINVKTLFGVESVKNTQAIDLVIKLEEWNKEKEYDRLGLEEQYIEYLGNKVVCHSIPIRPGRNLAVIVESAAVNHRQKKMGYNAAQELYNRVTNNLMKKNKAIEE